MKTNIKISFEMTMMLMEICNPNEYGYSYKYIGKNEWQIETEDEDLMEEMANELYRYIRNDERTVSTEDCHMYEIAEEILKAMK